MPHAVIVGCDATALYVGGRLAARGFDVTLLEAGQCIGGHWVQKLHDKSGCHSAYNAWEDGVFLDFPLAPPRRSSSGGGSCDASVSTVPTSFAGGGKAGAPPAQAKGPPPPPVTEQDLLRHLAGYAHAAGLQNSVRLGCTLRRAKWQAMNACWRLELKSEGSMQRGQLSADLLVVSKAAVAAPRLPSLPGRELYCGTVLTVNDQLTGPGGSAVLDQQLRGRHVLVVGGAGGPAAGWAEAARRHAGAGGSVVLLEVEDEDAPAAATVAAQPPPLPRGLLSRLLSCWGGGCDAGSRPGRPAAGVDVLGRYSPAQPACEGEPPLPGPGMHSSSTEALAAAGGSTDSAAAGTEASGREADAMALGIELTDMAAAGRSNGGVGEQEAGPEGAASGGGGRSEERAATSTRRAGGQRAERAADGGRSGGGGGGGEGSCAGQKRDGAGRSSLRVIRGVGALLNGTHVTLSSGEELPAEVVLLVPLSGLEPNLSFLDAGPPPRASHAGASSSGVGGGNSFKRGVSVIGTAGGGAGAGAGGSFRRLGSTLASGPSMSSIPLEASGVARQLDGLYRDMVSNSPAAPNLALVGAGARPEQHDARAAAAQAAWLLATWAGRGAGKRRRGASGGGGGTADSGGDGGGAGGGERAAWGDAEATATGCLRQATPVEAAADAALRARWRAEAARRGRPELYLQAYLRQLLADLGAPQGRMKTLARVFSCGRSDPAAAAATGPPLTRQQVARLLGVRRLRRPARTSQDESGHRHSTRTSPFHTPRASPLPGRSYSGAQAYGGTVAAAMLTAAAERSSASRTILAERNSASHMLLAAAASERNSASLLMAAAASGVSRDASVTAAHRRRSHSSASYALASALRERSVSRGASGGLVMLGSAATGVGGSGSGGIFGGGESPLPRSNSGYSGAFAGSQLSAMGRQPSTSWQAQQQLPLPPPALATQVSQRGSPSSFSRGSMHLLALQEQLYRVAEHPAEHLGDAGVATVPVTAPLDLTLTPGPSCPPSPGGGGGGRAGPSVTPLSSGVYGSVGSVSGNGRSRLLSSSLGGVGSLPIPASPFAGLAAGPGSTSFTGGAAVGGGGGVSVGALAAAAAAAAATDEQQRVRSQLLTRHRSTSRLAGVSHASGGPPPPLSLLQMGPGTASTGLSFIRRAPVASSSQVCLDGGQSFTAERVSQNGGRNSFGRRLGAASFATAGAGGSPALLSRGNSAARLQLLVAAANSASRKRMMAVGSPSAVPASPEPHSPGGGAGVRLRGPSGTRLQTTRSEALPPLHVESEGLLLADDGRLSRSSRTSRASRTSPVSGLGPSPRVSGTGAGMVTVASVIALAALGSATPGASPPASSGRSSGGVYGTLPSGVVEVGCGGGGGDRGPAMPRQPAGAIAAAAARAAAARGDDSAEATLHGDIELAMEGGSNQSLKAVGGGGGGGADGVSRRKQPASARRSVTLPDLRLTGSGYVDDPGA